MKTAIALILVSTICLNLGYEMGFKSAKSNCFDTIKQFADDQGITYSAIWE